MRDVRSDFHRRLFFVAAFLVVGFMPMPRMDSGPEDFAPGNYTTVTNELVGWCLSALAVRGACI